LQTIAPHARALGAEAALQELGAGVIEGYSDAGWVRQAYAEVKSLNDVVRLQSELWMGRTKVHA
jgi:carboxylate-amine ligase